MEKNYRNVFPICPIPDVQGGPKRLKPLNRGGEVLNHFTATCGPDIFRGDRLPADIRGDLLFAEPVGRLIRRSNITAVDGVTTLSNAHPQSEFIRSTDPNFRPVNMKTAPDGTLYIVDMYRGIIQERNWTKPGSYLRSVIDRYGFEKNIQHGRIYRLVHKDFKPNKKKPNMIGTSSFELVKHLKHPNGWWRDTAQKILVLRKDKAIVAQLSKLLNDSNHLTRIHALWTLEGTGSLSINHVKAALEDKHPAVIRAGIRVAETMIKSRHYASKSIMRFISQHINHNDPEVVIQALLTSNLLNFKNLDDLKNIESQSTSSGVRQTLAGMAPATKSQSDLPKALYDQHKRGETIYQQLCISCHGPNGKGVKTGTSLIAPPLSGSASVNGHKDLLINILLHGLEGPIAGQNYSSPMLSMKTQDDQWIADVISYIRHDLGNKSGFITTEDVAKVRALSKTREEFWTLTELNKITPQKLDKSKWKISASHNNTSANQAIDNSNKTRYTSAANQTKDMWIKVELPEKALLSSIRLDTIASEKEFPDSFIVEVSLNGRLWKQVQKTTRGTHAITEFNFPETTAKFFRITTKSEKELFWSIHEIEAFAR